MPTYEYACQSCGHDLEAFQRMSEDPLKVCPSCSEPTLKRKIGRGAGIIFKGGGFYETDFKDRKGTPSKEGDSSGKASESSNSGSSEKPASKDTGSSSKSEAAKSTKPDA